MFAHLIRPAYFTGMSCIAYQRRDGSGVGGPEGQESAHEQQLLFRCMTGAHNTSLNNFPLKVRPISNAPVTVTVYTVQYVHIRSCCTWLSVLANCYIKVTMGNVMRRLFMEQGGLAVMLLLTSGFYLNFPARQTIKFISKI